MKKFIRHLFDKNEALVNIEFIEKVSKGQEDEENGRYLIIFYSDYEADIYSSWVFESEEERDVAFDHISEKIAL